MYAMTLDDNLNFDWKEVADPIRKPDEVLIKVHAAAINRADLMQKDGCYASPEGWPQWCGLEASGEVVEAPEESGFKPGDKVCALLGGGGYSELVTAPAGMVIPIPEGLSMVEAASLVEVWATVYLNLQMEAGGMNPGDVFYMQAGASGVGLAAIQYAKLLGAEVITTIDSPEKAEFVRNLGADYVLDYRKEDVRPVIEAHPPTVALDCIGGPLMGECFRNMVFGGRWIMIATMGEIEQNAAKFSLSDRQIPIRVKLPEQSREDLETIKNLPVQTANGGSVPLSRVADVSFGSGPTTIQRYNQNRRVLVGADLAQGVVKGEAQAEIDALPILQDLPQGVIRDVVGEDEWQQELMTSLLIAIVSGVLLVFAVLVLLYKRLMSPLVNMTSLALAPLGGILLVWLFGQPQSMPVYIGILLLLGIVSKNSILLIDFAIEEMDKGTRKLHAIIDAGHKRAQPIVMTTVAMTAGMVPTALSGVLGSGDGAWRAPMGTVVIGGLILSTVLTLLIVPAGFSLADGFEKRAGPWLRNRLLTYKDGDDSRGVLGEGPPQSGVEPAE